MGSEGPQKRGVPVKVLITVKTYPQPSVKYRETVCTAGVLEDGGFIRLYPIDYRYKPYWQWYHKYQWVTATVIKHERDPRPESFRPVGAITPLGRPLGTQNKWAERKKYVLAQGTQTMCWLQDRKQHEVSLGIIRPLVQDFLIEPGPREWSPRHKALMAQLELFGPGRKPLERIPYRFYYVFKCEDPRCRGHKMQIIDWEIGQLYRSMRNKFESEEIACRKVKEKFLDKICAPDRNTYFFVGTVLQFGTWLVLGTFWPPK